MIEFTSKFDIDSYFREDNILYEKTNETHGFAHLSLKNIYFKSIHDAKNFDCEIEIAREIKNYIERYRRRSDRFLSRLRSKNHVVLVHLGDVSAEAAMKVRSNIQSITSKKVPIVCLDYFGHDVDDIDDKDLFFRVNYTRAYHQTAEFVNKTNWMWMNFIDWEKAFSLLLKVHEITRPRTNIAFL